MKKTIYLSLMILISGLSGACNRIELPPPIACSPTGDDSQGSSSELTYPINSVFNAMTAVTYHTFSSPRTSMFEHPVDLSYLVHQASGSPKALLVLIAGGQLIAGISGTTNIDGDPAASAGGNFLVRSAHLFAQQGYKVVTIDQPSDAYDYTGDNGKGWALDGYRVSLAHAVDLSAIINRANDSNLPVLIAGTSRGGVSAVAHSELASAIALSNPVTGGNNGHPVTHADAARVKVPAHVLWHDRDACGVTAPVNSYTLAGAFPDGSHNGLVGGFSPTGTNLCGGYSYHGFLGIESCAVNTSTSWMDEIVSGLATTRPSAPTISLNTSGSGISIVLNDYASADPGNNGALSYSLPFSSLSRGGRVTLNDSVLTYTPQITGVVESLVYVVKEAGGGRSHNTIQFTVQ